MTLIQKLALVAFSVLLCSSYSASNAQTVDPVTGLQEQVTGNLIQPNWTGAQTQVNPGGGGPGQGGYAVYDSATGTIRFSHSGPQTASQLIGINQALANAGTGVQLTGYNYGWNITTQTQNGLDPVHANISLLNTAGTAVVSKDYHYTTSMTNQRFTGAETFTTPYATSTLSNLKVSFTGNDGGYWGGWYGSTVSNISVALRYGVDPCVANPAYSPTCPGFNQVLTSTNLVPYPEAGTSWGNGINNSFAINTALQNSGTGLTIYGFKYGFNTYVGGEVCSGWWIFSSCDGSASGVDVNITNKTGQSIYYKGYYTPNNSGWVSYNDRYLFKSPTNSLELGNFNYTGWTSNNAGISGMYSQALYSPDPCTNNPLYSPNCTGYATAMAGKITGSVYTAPPAAAPPPPPAADPTRSAPTTTNVGGVELSTSGSISAPDGVPQVVKDSQPPPPDASQPPPPGPPQTAGAPPPPGPSAGPSAGPATASSNSGKGPSNAVMNAVKAVAEQNKANETKAVANAQAVVATSTAQSQETAATAIANIATQTVASSQTVQQSSSQQQQMSSMGGLSLNKPTGPGISVFSSMGTSSLSMASVQTTSSVYYKAETKSYDSNESQTITQQNVNPRSDPLAMLMQQPNVLQQSNIEQRSDTVRKNVQPNELAGGVDIAAMASVPVGFGNYSLVMRDTAFYAPKEIYRNQNVVDNARALRQLGSDMKHKEMVDSQYK